MKTVPPTARPLAGLDWGPGFELKVSKSAKPTRQTEAEVGVKVQAMLFSICEGTRKSTRRTNGLGCAKSVTDQPKSVESRGGAAATSGIGERPFTKTDIAEPGCAGFAAELSEPSALRA